MIMKRNFIRAEFIDQVGLVLIGVVSFLYYFYGSYFAEFHLKFSFLSFPIFIGEFLFFICSMLFALKVYLSPVKMKKSHYLVFFYILFVLFKALTGYYFYGPLALRNAALMYYPIFICFAISFYRKEFFSKPVLIFIFSTIISMFAFRAISSHILLTFSLIAIIVILSYSQKILTRLFMGVIVCAALPFGFFFHTSRMMIVGNFVSVIYLTTALSIILSSRFKSRKVVAGVIVAGMIASVGVSSNISAVKSIISVKAVKKRCDYFKSVAHQMSQVKKKEQLEKVQVYNPNSYSKLVYNKPKRNSSVKKDGGKKIIKVPIGKERSSVVVKNDGGKKIIKVPTEKERSSVIVEKHKSPNLLRLGNIMFRIFIWQDMMEELIEEKPLLGFSYGKPLRSKTIEMLGWASAEWRRDGWIGAHNSWFHIVYRAGIVGIAFICFIIGLLVRMIVFYIKHHSVRGILLCGIIINWFVAANFLLILELPYTAIPIWSIFGLNYAYYRQLRKELGEVNVK